MAGNDEMIIGDGMIASGLRRRGPWPDCACFIAAGVADSRCHSVREFGREIGMLHGILRRYKSKTCCMVYFGSAAMVGSRSPYAVHKRACEALVRSAGSYLIVRVPNVVGPGGNMAQLVPSLVYQSIGGNMSVEESASRDLLGIDELCEQLMSIEYDLMPRRTITIASGVDWPALKIASTISAVLGLEPTIHEIAGGSRQRFIGSQVIRPVRAIRLADRYPEAVLRSHVPAIATMIGTPITGGVAI